jgi:hypothetical protein
VDESNETGWTTLATAPNVTRISFQDNTGYTGPTIAWGTKASDGIRQVC